MLILLITLLSNCFFANNTENALWQQEMLLLVNKARSKGCNCGNVYYKPTGPVTLQTMLTDAAYQHARDMNRKNYFSHISKNGDDMGDRIKEAGYTPKGFKRWAVGENIAFGYSDVSSVVADWLKSPLHCKNIMDPEFKEVGFAKSGNYWVQDFGVRKPHPKP